MNYREYLKDRWLHGLPLAGFLFLEISFGILSKVPAFYLWITGVGTIGIFFFLSYVSYAERKNFYQDMEKNSRSLDQAYLLPELLERPEFLEGKVMYDAMLEMERSMAERIQKFEENNREYKEYIELWVHEIKLPIATGKLLVENNREFYDESMMEELEQIDAYTEQALFYARSNYVEKDYVLKRVSLKQICTETIQKNRRLLLKEKIQISLHDLDEIVFSDSKWLAFILQQILSNSVKYMGEGERKLEWYARVQQEKVKLYLRDTGTGISAKDLPRVFEKGFTGENGRTGKKSTGLGLYLCRKLCEKMGHKLEIVSSQGKGCQVIISFPKGSMTGEIF